MLTENEKRIIQTFQQTRIPSIYKLDNTDNILYIEHVDFDLCKMILKEKKISKEWAQCEILEYSKFLSQINIISLDAEALEHLRLVNAIISLFIKYCIGSSVV